GRPRRRLVRRRDLAGRLLLRKVRRAPVHVCFLLQPRCRQRPVLFAASADLRAASVQEPVLELRFLVRSQARRRRGTHRAARTICRAAPLVVVRPLNAEARSRPLEPPAREPVCYRAPVIDPSGSRSSRRFSRQAASSWPVARGFSFPLLMVVRREPASPRSTRYRFAASARRWPSARLYSAVPRPSQLPSIRMRRSERFWTEPKNDCSFDRESSESVELS